MTRQTVRILSTVALIAFVAGAALAEQDFKYGMKLYSEFGFEDLAEKFFLDMKDKGAGDARLSGILGLGGIKEEQAKAAEAAGRPGKAQTLYKEARELYDRFLKEAPGNNPERGTALLKKTELMKKEALNKVKQAREEKDKDAKRRLLSNARNMLEELTKPLEKEAKRAKGLYDKHVEDKGPFEQLRTSDRAERLKLLDASVVATQRLYLMQIELAEVYEKGSEERKKFLEDMTKAISKDSEYWEAEEYMGVVMWLNHMLGRCYALAGNPKKAYEEGFDPIIAENPQQYAAGGPRDFVDNIRMVAFYLKAKTASDLKDFQSVIKVVDQMFMPVTGYPGALSDDDRANGAMLFRAEAHIKKDEPDWAAGIRDCQKVIDANYGAWPNNARQLLAQTRHQMPADAAVSLGPAVLHSMAFGDYQLALQAQDPKERKELFESAVGGYEQAIIACRGEETSYHVRLDHEATSWFELGVCYWYMRLWYESGFAFEAVLRFFAKDKIGHEIADWPEFAEAFTKIKDDIKLGTIKPEIEGGVVDPNVELFNYALKDSSLNKMLVEIDGRLKKSAKNLMASAGRRRRESKWTFDQGRYSQAIDILLQVDPEKRKELDFHRAANKKSEAETYFAQRKMTEAVEAWEEAAGLFLRAAQRIPSKREMSYHLAAKCFYRAMTEAKKLGRRASPLAEKVEGLGRQAIAAFSGFERAVKEDEDIVDEKVLEQRARRTEEALLIKPLISHALGEYEQAVEGADLYLAREEKNPDYVRTLIWKKFTALKELATRALGTDEEEARLEALIETAEAVRASPAEQFYSKACQIISANLQDAASRLEAKAKEAGGDATLSKRAEEYRLESAKWMKKVIEMTPEDQRDLGFMAQIAQEFYKQKAYVGARDIYLDILSTHDADGDGVRRQLNDATFANASTAAIFDRKDLMDAVRGHIAELQLYVNGEPESERTDKRTKKILPPSKRNWRKSAKAVDKLFEFYPMVRNNEKLTEMLVAIRDELKFRLQIMAVRLNLSDCSRALGRQQQEANPEEAKTYWQEAAELIEKVREYHWRDNELRVLQAECHKALGQIEEAAELYSEAAQKYEKWTPEWYAASRAFSDIAFEMGRKLLASGERGKAAEFFRKAMFLADMVVGTGSEDEWKEYFPDAREYIVKCEKAIEEAGKKVVLQDHGEPEIVDYDPPSDFDLELIRQLTGIEQRIKQKLVKEEDRKKEAIAAARRHFTNLARKAYTDPETMARMTPPQIKKSEVDATRKVFLARILYQSPIQQKKLRKLVIALGGLEDMAAGMAADLLAPHIKKKAIELGLLTADGEKKPKSEIPKELLKKEDIYGVGPVEMKAPAPGEEAPAGEQADGAAEGTAEQPAAEEPAEEPATEQPAAVEEGVAP